ncbi:MAG TPA: RNA methyltransferase [Mycobacteriales bacterium]|nr:RNA methyltransferase [Mycobacteriales bacterium]
MDSPRNARILAARALHSARGRRTASALLAEGPHAVAAAQARSFEIREVFVTDEAADRERPLMRELARSGVPIHAVTERALRAVAETVTPQGIVAVVASPAAPTLPAAPRLVAVLERCSDPGNAGTVIRTADAVGADAVVLGAGSVDVWAGKCVRASAGSVFNLPVITSLSAVDAVTALRDRGCRILATAADGEVALDELAPAGRLAGPTAWVFGSEAHGLGGAVSSLVDDVVRIPISGRAESYNLSAAAAICLYSSATAQRANPR